MIRTWRRADTLDGWRRTVAKDSTPVLVAGTKIETMRKRDASSGAIRRKRPAGRLAGLACVLACLSAALCLPEHLGAVEAIRTAATAPIDLPAAKAADYHRDIKPILVKHCYVCHGPSRAESGLRLDLRSHAMRGGDSGPAVVKGNSAESLLYQYVSGNNESGSIMPPEGQTPLSEEQVALLRTWIDQGATWPLVPQGARGDKPDQPPIQARQDSPPAASEHWAFQPVKRIKPPVIRHPWIDTPIDAFVMQKLGEQRLTPSPEASRRELIRRVSFDLIGLPPTPDDVESFVADTSPDAYERLVDSLLASPHYGERWARHWLDLARYADSDGFEDDNDRPHAYKYRDWVIKSLNDDKPYDQFILEQLAGDELDADNPEFLTALGFCRAGPTISNQINAKNRADEVDDIVSTTAAVFLGTTVGCARCHDHKFEPISQRDYYRMYAVFDNTQKINDGEIPHVRDPALSAHKSFVMLGGDPARQGEEVDPGVPQVLENGRALFPRSDAMVAGSVGRRLALARWIADPENPLTARVIVNRIWMYHFGRGLVNTPSNFGQSGAAPSHLELLDYLAGEFVRLGWRLKKLNKAIVMSATYRQSSAYDPIKAGLDPDNEWYSRYPLRRLEAEAIRDAMLAASGKLNSQMYGPGIRPRIPESLLATSSKQMWPKVTREGPEHWRRSVYIFAKRGLPVPMLEGFDAPTGTQTCDRRMCTTVATQALQLMNDEFSNEQAQHMAERVVRDAGGDARKQIERAYWLAFSRGPTEAEWKQAETFLKQQVEAEQGEAQTENQAGEPDLATTDPRADAHRRALVDFCHVLFNSNEFVYVN